MTDETDGGPAAPTYETVIMHMYGIQAEPAGACACCGKRDGSNRRHTMMVGLRHGSDLPEHVVMEDIFWDQAHGLWNLTWRQELCMPCAVLSMIDTIVENPGETLATREQRERYYHVLVPAFNRRGHTLALCTATVPGPSNDANSFCVDIDQHIGAEAFDTIFRFANDAVNKIGPALVSGHLLTLEKKGNKAS